MGIFNDFFKKERPVFTGLKFGFGSGGGGGASEPPSIVDVLFAEYSTSYTSTGTATDDSSVKVLSPEIKYLYVIGCGGGGGGGHITSSNHGRGGGGGAAAIRRLCGYSIPSANQGQPIQVKVGQGGRSNIAGSDTDILINGSSVLKLNGGSTADNSGGAGGTVSIPGLTRLPSFNSNLEASGGNGGNGGDRYGNPGASTSGQDAACAGGGGGGGHVNYKEGSNGGSSAGPGGMGSSTVSYDIVQKNFQGSLPNPFPIALAGESGGAGRTSPPGYGTGTKTAGGSGLAQGGGGYSNDNNTGGSGGAGAGMSVNTPNDPGPTFHGGGGGGVRSQITAPTGDSVVYAAGGAGFIIVVGSSYELVSGVDY